MWEIVARLRDLDGGEEDRIDLLASETDLHPRQIRAALEFAACHPEQIKARIERNQAAIEAGRAATEARHALLG